MAPDGGWPSPKRLPTRVLVALTPPLKRMGMRAILDASPDLAVVGEASTEDELHSAWHRLQPDVVIMDDDVSGFHGRALRTLLEEASPHTRVLIMSQRDAPEPSGRALAYGAAAIVYADASVVELLRALRDVSAGVTPRAAAPLRRTERGDPTMVGALSDREQEVLVLLARGSTNREIAEALSVTQHTAKKHIEHIFIKLGVNDRTAAAVRAVELGLVGGRRRFASALSSAQSAPAATTHLPHRA